MTTDRAGGQGCDGLSLLQQHEKESRFGRQPDDGYDLGGFFDEMFEAPGRPRPHYRELLASLARLSPESLEERSRVANSFFLNQGIGFTVYGDEQGTDRIFAFDLVPRIVPADEWTRSKAASNSGSAH